MPRGPTNRTVRDLGAGVSGFTWRTVREAVRDFVWNDLRHGMMDVGGLDRNARALVRFGFALLAVTLAALVFSGTWRLHSDLVVISYGSGRGITVPTTLLPFTLFLLVSAWSFVLAGALHIRPVVRVLILSLYLLHGIGWMQPVLDSLERYPWGFYAATGSLVGTVAFFVLRRRAKVRPAFEFAVLFALTAIIFLIVQRHELRSVEQFNISLIPAKAGFSIESLRGLVTPLLLLIGIDIADFARRLSHWSTDVVAPRVSSRWLVVLLVGLLGWRICWAIVEFLEFAATRTAAELMLGYGGGLIQTALVVVTFGLVVFAARRRETPSEQTFVEAASRLVFPLVIAYSFVQWASYLLLHVAYALPPKGMWQPIRERVLQANEWLGDAVTSPWHLGLSAAALIIAAVLVYRGRIATALYIAVFGVLLLWGTLTRSDEPLGLFYWRGSVPVELWWLVLFVAAAAYRLARGEFTRARQVDLLFLLVIATIIRQRDFIENPFSPLFGFAGVAFIAFGLVWDMSTRGSWANADTPALPRESRAFMYLGYILLAATVLNWAVASHDLDRVQQLTGGAALVGFDRFGMPLLYTVYLLTLLRPETPRDDSAAHTRSV